MRKYIVYLEQINADKVEVWSNSKELVRDITPNPHNQRITSVLEMDETKEV